MKDLIKYLEILFEFAKQKLKKDFQVDKLELNNFEIINSYLIYQTIKGKKKNTLIYIPNKKTKSQFYIPTIFVIALYNFIDNYLDDTTKYKEGDVVQKNGERFRINEISKIGYRLEQEKFNSKAVINLKTTKFVKPAEIKSYIITTANLKNRKVKLKFEFYKDFFNRILDIEKDEMPSRFKYKSVIVTDKSIVDELKEYTIENHSIHKAFPFQYITKSGKKTDNLPIDPMIYIVNDYETARKHIFDKSINVCNITIIGSNKYKDNYLDISEDLNNKRVENCLMIGSADISENAIPDLLKWKWTLPELNFFNYFTTYPINKIVVENDELSNHIKDFNFLITQIENDYGINLKELYRFIRHIFPIIIPSSESRLITQLDNSLIYFEKEGQDIVETAFYEIDEYDCEEIWQDIVEKFSSLIDCKRHSQKKFEKVQGFDSIDYLVAPKEYLGIWSEEVNKDVIRNVISFKDFENLDTANKTIVFLGFFGYNHLKSMMYNSNKINIILYLQENEHFDNCFNRLKRETYNELRNSDRKDISDISFKETEQNENISELIKRLFEQDEETKINPDYLESCSSNICRELTFENDSDILELDENKTVLLKINQNERFEKVKNLTIGDKIRVYDNSSKEELYQVALEFDTNGEFTKIEEFSKLWKKEFQKFYRKFNSLNELHQHLANNGLSIKNELTLKNWVNPDSDVKFPQSKKDLFVLKRTINSNLINGNFSDILKCRRLFNGIMIALGRDFSDEITDYFQNKIKGKLLKQFSERQIQQFVEQNLKKRIIKTIKAIDNDQ